MRLRTAALLVIVGIAGDFVIRLLGTLLPSLFANLPTALITISVHILADLALLAFFVLFRNYGELCNTQHLRQAALIAVFGVAVGLLLPLKALLFHARIFIYLPLLLTRSVELLAPPIAMLTMVYFLIVFLQEASLNKRDYLARGIRYGLAGAGLFFFLHVLVAMNFVIHYRFNYLSQISNMVTWISLPLVVAATASLFYFFLVIRKSADR